MKKNIIALFVISIFAGIAKFLHFPIETLAGLGFIGFSGTITTDRREREDLSSAIDILMLKEDDMKYLSFVNFLPSILKNFGRKVTAQKHEWLDDLARYQKISVIASGASADWDTNNDITALPVVTAEITKLRVGDLLLLGDLSEVVQVKSINVAGQTIDLIARGHGSTAAAAQGTVAFDCLIIGNAQAENGDPIDADFTPQTANYNYTQIFESVASISGTLRRSKMAGGQDELTRQEMKKLKESLKELNRTLVEGIKNLDTTNNIATMGGLREFITNTSNAAGELSLANIYTAINAHITAGLYPSAIHGSPTTIGKLEQLFISSVRSTVNDKKHGIKITTISIQGYDVQLHVDRDVRSTELLILDYNRIGFGELDGGVEGQSGAFAVYPLLDKKNGKQIASQVLGEYTLHVQNGGGTRMYGIT